MLINKIHYDFFHLFIFFSLLFKKVQKVHCSTFTADCSLFKKTHCHSIVIHSHTIVSICNAVRKQLCDHCINYCVTIVIIVHCLQVFLQYCFPNLFNLVFLLSSTLTSTSNIINPINLVFSIYSILFFQSFQSFFSILFSQSYQSLSSFVRSFLQNNHSIPAQSCSIVCLF